MPTFASRKPQRNVAVPKALKHRLNGQELKPGSYPSEFTSRPWYPLVVRIENPGLIVTANDIGAAIATQLFGANPPSTDSLPLQARLTSVRFWGNLPVLSGTNPLPPVTLQIYDTIAAIATPRILQQFTRYSDAVKRAAVGYQYPLAQSSVVLTVRGPNALTSPILQMSGTGTSSVVYLNVLWRSGSIGVTPVTSETGEFLT